MDGAVSGPSWREGCLSEHGAPVAPVYGVGGYTGRCTREVYPGMHVLLGLLASSYMHQSRPRPPWPRTRLVEQTDHTDQTRPAS